MEIILYSVLAISIILNIILFYRGIRLVRIVEALQNEYELLLDDTTEYLEGMLDEMREIDIRGSFESDDEVGSVFNQLKDLIQQYKENL
jgi:hypothetical protein